MSGHHLLSRPSLQNSSHPSGAISFATHEEDSHASSGAAPESRHPSQTQAIPPQHGAAKPDSEPTQPEMEIDVQPHMNPSPAQPPTSRSSHSPNIAMFSSPKSSPRSNSGHLSAPSSPADKAMDVSVSPKQRTNGFNPPSSRRSSDGKQTEDKDDMADATNQATGISPNRSDSGNSRNAEYSSSPNASKSPRRVRVFTNNDGSTQKVNQDGTSSSQPTSNSDSSYTPASSPPPQTPNSDDATHNGDPPSSVSEKRTETSSSSGEMKEGSSPIDPSATPHMDLATYPTQDLLKLLASLLQQIASANDALREEAFSHKADHLSSALISKPASPSTRNRTRASSGSEVAGQLCLPAFRPRPAGVEQPQGPSQPSTTHAAEKDSTAPQRDSSQQETSSNDEKTEAVSVDESVAETQASSASAMTEKPEENGETPAKAFTADSAKASLPETETATDSPGSTNTLHPRRSDAYRITTTAARQSLVHPSAILCFHARNVPSISIEAYLQRILKYCPITNEVFLSLLVYFDRMSKMQLESGQPNGASIASEVKLQTGIQGFAIDSYNVHRLVIAGITVASKFFSDVFYTNSRYAKVRCAECFCTGRAHLPSLGRRPSSERAQSAGATISASQRL